MQPRPTENSPLLKNKLPAPTDAKEAKITVAENKDDLPDNIVFLTQNIGEFPREEFGFPFPQINKDVLAANELRNPFIIQNILKENPDVFALQEVWDKDTAKEFMQEFGKRGYHCVHGGMGLTIIDGGIMLFSKFPIVEHKIVVFDNPPLNIEAYARKRAILAKLRIDKTPDKPGTQFITIATHHLYGGLGDELPEEVRDFGGTSSFRRGQALGKIHQALFKKGLLAKTEWYRQPPPRSYADVVRGKKPLKYLGGFVMGDYNLSLDVSEVKVENPEPNTKYYNDRKRRSVSLGMSGFNKFEENDIKYPGQYNYFSEVLPITASNSIEPREDIPKSKGAGKQRVAALVEEVKKIDESTGNEFTGTDRNNLKDFALSDGTPIPGSANYAASRTIDGLYPLKPHNANEKRGDFDLQVVSLDGEVTLEEAEKIEKAKKETPKKHNTSKSHSGNKKEQEAIKLLVKSDKKDESNTSAENKSDKKYEPKKYGMKLKENGKVRLPISDHFGMKLRWNLRAPYQERQSIYEGSLPQPSKSPRENPGEGGQQHCLQKFCCCFACGKKMPVSKLFPTKKVIKTALEREAAQDDQRSLKFRATTAS